VSYYATTEELEQELEAFLSAFLASDDGTRAADAARQVGDSAILTLRLLDPDAVVSVDFLARTLVLGPVEGADVEVEMEADALHDLLLDRLGPVEISRLYETDRVRFTGGTTQLAGLVLAAGPLQPYYERSLEARGRTDLLETPAPETPIVWGDPSEATSPPQLIGRRRRWQRPKRTVA
jgi:hypothetical protein